jgi:hypothetical protein
LKTIVPISVLSYLAGQALAFRPLVIPNGSDNGQIEIEELDSGIYLRGSSQSRVTIWHWSVGSGESNRMMSPLIGDRLTEPLNDEVVIQNAPCPAFRKAVPSDSGNHGGTVDFANT